MVPQYYHRHFEPSLLYTKLPGVIEAEIEVSPQLQCYEVKYIIQDNRNTAGNRSSQKPTHIFFFS